MMQPAFYPVNDREKLDTMITEPAVHGWCATVDILLGPAAWPGIIRSKLGKRRPILERQLGRIVRAYKPLLGRVNEKDAPK
jgi:hypothetical protein